MISPSHIIHISCSQGAFPFPSYLIYIIIPYRGGGYHSLYAYLLVYLDRGGFGGYEGCYACLMLTIWRFVMWSWEDWMGWDLGFMI